MSHDPPRRTGLDNFVNGHMHDITYATAISSSNETGGILTWSRIKPNAAFGRNRTGEPDGVSHIACGFSVKFDPTHRNSATSKSVSEGEL